MKVDIFDSDGVTQSTANIDDTLWSNNSQAFSQMAINAGGGLQADSTNSVERNIVNGADFCNWISTVRFSGENMTATNPAVPATSAQKEDVSDAKFSNTFKAYLAGHATITDLLHGLGKAHGMIHFNTALVLGKNPISALKLDLQKLGNSKTAIASKDYFRAWMIATHGGDIKGHALPTPPSVTKAMAPKTEVGFGAAGKAALIAVGFGGLSLMGNTPGSQAFMKSLAGQAFPFTTFLNSAQGQAAIRAYQQSHAGLYVTGRYDTDMVAALKADGVGFPPPNPVAPLKHLNFHLQPHPTQAVAAVAPVLVPVASQDGGMAPMPIPVPVDQQEVIAATGQPVVAPVPPPGSSLQAATPSPQWKLGGAAALAVPGFFVAGPPGAAGGAIAGLLGGKVLDDKIKAGLMQPIFARDEAGKISLSLSLKKWTGKLPAAPAAAPGTGD